MYNTGVLVLNIDHNPLHITNWKRAVCLILNGKATLVEAYDKYIYKNIKKPKIIRLNRFINYFYKSNKAAFSRLNLYIRDNYTCAYCGQKFNKNKLSIDHIIPKSKGGATNFENCITACIDCNFKKGDKTLKEVGMNLLFKPYIPSPIKLLRIKFKEYFKIP